MGTRANIIVQFGQTKVYLYRHWDGYPAVTGADLARKLIDSKDNAGKFITALLTQVRGGKGDDKDSPQYEVTTSVHGDIEWLYAFRFDEEEGVALGWADSAFGSDRDKAYQKAMRATADLDALVYMVNKAIIDKNRRAIEMGYDTDPVVEIPQPDQRVAS